jgi:hypothetical protein
VIYSHQWIKAKSAKGKGIRGKVLEETICCHTGYAYFPQQQLGKHM